MSASVNAGDVSGQESLEFALPRQGICRSEGRTMDHMLTHYSIAHATAAAGVVDERNPLWFSCDWDGWMRQDHSLSNGRLIPHIDTRLVKS